MAEATIKFSGSSHMKHKLILATLAGKSIKITDIRSFNGGVQEYEINLIRLIDKLTNGTKIKLHPSGTEIDFIPGILHGGSIEHQCCVEKSIGYYLDVLIAFGPFCKFPIDAKLKGVTNSFDSPSVDHIRSSAFNIMKRFIIEEDAFELKILKRGMMPDGGGEISFKIKPVLKLRALQLVKTGMVKRIRGTVYSCKVSPTFSNRTIESAKGIMLNFIPDVYLHTDQHKGKSSGLSPGYGVILNAETTENVIFSTEIVNMEKGILPEDVGKFCANKLLDEIYRGGCCDSTFQWLMMLYMALGPKSVSKVVTGPFSRHTVTYLQLIKEILGVKFKIESYEEEEDDEDDSQCYKVMVACVGLGYTNLAKRAL
ncbi:hypothetical protein PVAND_008481 [Polypedilum vanderplanki]|uniref:RNA 3'-terminal phosphate cyclase-like protein n=1 Tax=Polypedilum vanderplanki TaxID=319348 RepID=A0A9J6CAD5_POLVA|nr:hypothetical protein PVAND_008481 [Polypedilum vanderplanki]